MVILKLLGGVGLLIDGKPVEGRAAQPRRLALLALLAVAGPHGISRDKVVGYLWPDRPTRKGRHLLSDSLYVLRKALGRRAVIARGDVVRLNPQVVQSDVQRFVESLRRGEREGAVEVYAGPLLDGVHLHDSPEWEQWLYLERERLAHAFAGAVRELAERREAEGEWWEAVELWQRLATDDPLDALATTRLMLTLHHSGNRAAALEHAQRHAALLRQEYGAEPSPEVEALARRLREHPEPSEPFPASSAGLPPPSPPEVAPPPTRPRRHPAAAVGIGLVLLALVIALTRARRAGGPTLPTVHLAVLPFTDLTETEHGARLGREIPREVARRMTEVRGRRVEFRNASAPASTDSLSPGPRGRHPRVQLVLVGSIHTSGDTLLAAVQLLGVGRGVPLWSATYRRPAHAPGAVGDIAAAIARAVQAALRAHAPAAGGVGPAFQCGPGCANGLSTSAYSANSGAGPATGSSATMDFSISALAMPLPR